MLQGGSLRPVLRSICVLTFVCLAAVATCTAQEIDLLIRGGSLIDGSGAPAKKADIGITGDRIVFVGPSAGRKAKRVWTKR
jgi:N-acyl-D-amino-acid deacylase